MSNKPNNPENIDLPSYDFRDATNAIKEVKKLLARHMKEQQHRLYEHLNITVRARVTAFLQTLFQCITKNESYPPYTNKKTGTQEWIIDTGEITKHLLSLFSKEA